MNPELLYRYTLALQRERIDEAARQRLACALRLIGGHPKGKRSWRAALALHLRRAADWLERAHFVMPASSQNEARLQGMLRAVAHREIDVEQALVLLRSESCAPHRAPR